MLVLAQEMGADWLVIDEEKARAIARLSEFQLIGTVGVLLLAKQQGLIPHVKPLLDLLRRRKFRLGERIYRWALKEADEQ